MRKEIRHVLDFVEIIDKSEKGGRVAEFKFPIRHVEDIMIRGGKFYAWWNEKSGLWSTDIGDCVVYLDSMMSEFISEMKSKYPDGTQIRGLYFRDNDSRAMQRFKTYCEQQMWDTYVILDQKLVYADTPINKYDYSTKRLKYSLQKGSHKSWSRLVGRLYDEKNKHKIEWVIGAIVCGASRKLQKFMVLYGSAGTGKSTILNIISSLFKGYTSTVDVKSLGTASKNFAMEAFRNYPLVAIQHEGKLDKIDDNTRLNSLISHEEMLAEEKYAKSYATSYNSFLIVGSNSPVKITDAKSGLLRRLIDVSPTGDLFDKSEYNELVGAVDSELGAIAYHCMEVYLADPDYYDTYVPTVMLGATNDFYNYIFDNYTYFSTEEYIFLDPAYEKYIIYCEKSRIPEKARMQRSAFREELKNYFEEYYDRIQINGIRTRSVYSIFIDSKFEETEEQQPSKPYRIEFKEQSSLLDEMYKDCIAQYTDKEGKKPKRNWDDVKTTLKELDTSKPHYLLLPDMTHIFIDFDIPDENGNKCFELNYEAANLWPRTYSELSKSGEGIHLHYIYNGDPSELDATYAPHIEIKVLTGKQGLRRKLTKCNDIPVAYLSEGSLPKKKKKGKTGMIDAKKAKTEQQLAYRIRKAMRKEYPPGSTVSMIALIDTMLNDACEDGIQYDFESMRKQLNAFAANSSNHDSECLAVVRRMKLKNWPEEEVVIEPVTTEIEDEKRVFFDLEVAQNVTLLCWKYEWEDYVHAEFFPKPEYLEEFFKKRLYGYNCRRYDNHIMMGIYYGDKPMDSYRRSTGIISGDKDCYLSSAWNLSEGDVYDMATKKQSLKAWEIELRRTYGLSHREFPMAWDEPIPEERWEELAEYCKNDVIATEAVFHNNLADYGSRICLANLARAKVFGKTINDTTNTLTTSIIFGNDKNPQTQFNYRLMNELRDDDYIAEGYDKYTRFNADDMPIFDGYIFEDGVSTYRDVNESNPNPLMRKVGEGGYVYSECGMYTDVALLDIASMHPTTIIVENLFGDKYTDEFRKLYLGRLAVKHKDYQKAEEILGESVKIYLNDENADDLAMALKIAINSVYGLTSAKFPNPFRDERNKDNIVAKRGALFMINLRHEVQKLGYRVVHIKTDSIKIANADNFIINFVHKYGRLYGYNFEHEATYDRMCLVNKAVYIAQYASVEKCEELYGSEYVQSGKEVCAKNKKKAGKWDATGTQFQVPYVFKKLFSKEEIEFDDFCTKFEVKKGTLYLDMNEGLRDVTYEEKELKKLNDKYKHGKISDILLQKEIEDNDYLNIIASGHCYHFIGRIGLFVPVVDNIGGGVLYRVQNGNYYAASGTTGYRWMESDMVENMNLQKYIDMSYFEEMAKEAIEAIEKYGDFESFANGGFVRPHFWNDIPIDADEEIPFDE